MIIFLRGGLGNQLFQISMGIEIEKQLNERVRFSDVLLRRSLLSRDLRWKNYSLELGMDSARTSTFGGFFLRLLLGFFNIAASKSGKLVTMGTLLNPVEAIDLQQVHGKSYVDAPGLEMTSPEMLEDIRSRIVSARDRPIEPLKKFGSLHIRLGDYRALHKIYGSLSLEYVAKACHLLRQSLSNDEIERIVIFSDEPDQAENIVSQYLSPEQFSLSSAYCNSDFQEFVMMTQSSILFITNSSFSWWAAAVAGNTSRIFTPWPLLGPPLRLPQSFVPGHWQRLSI